MIVPYMKKLTDHIHSKGKLAELHSCGMNEIQVQNFIDAGWDSWIPMPMNDTAMLNEEYGDKIIIAVCADPLPESATEDEHYKYGVDFAKKYCRPGVAVTFSGVYSPDTLTPAFCRGLYETSRKIYANE